MTPEQFACWMQGFAELTPDPPSAAQWQSIREHVASLFVKETPPLRLEVPARLPLDDIRRRLEPRRSGVRDRIIC